MYILINFGKMTPETGTLNDRAVIRKISTGENIDSPPLDRLAAVVYEIRQPENWYMKQWYDCAVTDLLLPYNRAKQIQTTSTMIVVFRVCQKEKLCHH